MNFREQYVGTGKVVLLAGGGKVYADVAARFVKSERDLDDIVSSEYSPEIVKALLGSGHLSALEFDYFLFGVEGFSRVCEAQLVRKRMASYMIKSGRIDMGGQREFSVVWPSVVPDLTAGVLVKGKLVHLSGREIAQIISQWYEAGVAAGVAEEDLRYLKPQATEFKGLIGMNAHALRDWFSIRCCMNAQAEIHSMASSMLRLCKQVAPDLFEGAGPSCTVLGYCPENGRQHRLCRGRIPTKDEALKLIKSSYGREDV